MNVGLFDVYTIQYDIMMNEHHVQSINRKSAYHYFVCIRHYGARTTTSRSRTWPKVARNRSRTYPKPVSYEGTEMPNTGKNDFAGFFMSYEIVLIFRLDFVSLLHYS